MGLFNRRFASLLTAAVAVQGGTHIFATAFVPSMLPSMISQQQHYLSSSSDDPRGFRNIGWREMVDIVDQLEDGSDDYCVIDVRTVPEVQATGALGTGIHVIAVQDIMQRNVFGMDADDFEQEYGFEKPLPDQPIVFTCAAGIRSVYACQAAAAAGYTQLINYTGGANEWFSKQ